MLGTHNSFTYLKPTKWWMYPLRWTAKCQAVDIEKLYELGSRLFDLRVRFKGDKLILAHGIIEYPTTRLLESLTFLNKKNVYVRILLESNTEPKDKEHLIEQFKNFCSDLEHRFSNIKFFGGQGKWDCKSYYSFKYHGPTIDDKYASMDSLKYANDIWPWIYAICFNKSNIKKGTDKDYLFIDFINIQ